MTYRTGTPSWTLPLFDAADEGAGSAGATGATGGAGDQGNGNDDGQGYVFDAGKAFEGLEKDNLDWLQKNEALRSDPKALAKHAFNQEKLLGSAIRIPGKDAKPEEVEAFLTKLGRPAKAEEYKYTVPEKMPEGLPYDGDLAKSFSATAHKLGLTQAQAAGLHDMFVEFQVGAYGKATEASQANFTEKATKATEALVKRWGPLDGDTAQANFEIADKVFREADGGQELLAELKELKLVGPNKEILSEPLARVLASLGNAIYKEGDLLRGRVDQVGNPFADGEGENRTLQMKLIKEEPDRARSLIAAAGKKPSDFGMKS